MPGAVMGPTYLITGATSGLGLAFSKFIAQQGAGTVVLTGRSEDKLINAFEEVKSTANPQTTIKTLLLDMESHDSVRRAAEQITSGILGIPKVDILVNNAAIMAQPYKKIDGYESQFFCNHLSHFLFTNLILSHISSPGGRVISVSSYGHGHTPICFDDIKFKDGEVHDKWLGYETANILFAIGLNKRFSKSKGIQSFSVHPGSVAGTGLTIHIDFEAEGLGWTDENENMKLNSVTLDQGIATYLYAALSPELNGKGGAYLTGSQIKDTNFPMTDEDADRLWELSNSILGTEF